jgi:hypothetical protein
MNNVYYAKLLYNESQIHILTQTKLHPLLSLSLSLSLSYQIKEYISEKYLENIYKKSKKRYYS